MYNIYPVWWDKTITVYNKFTDPQTKVVTWYSYTVGNCFWKYVGNKVTVNNVVLETNDTICRIPLNADYLPKYLWLQQANDTRNNYFTLSQGDIIVLGEVNDVIDEYATGKRATDLISKYKALQGCIEIQDFADNTGAGRCNEHYYVRGV